MSSVSRSSAVLSLALSATLLFAAFAGSASAQTPKTDEEKAFYSIGVAYARQLQAMKPITDAELAILVQGLKDAVQDKELAIDAQEGSKLVRGMVQKRQKKAAATERTASAAFAEAEAAKSGAKTTESGLVYREVKAGSGPSPKATDKVKVHYHGTLRDGTVFDSSVERDQPAEFPLNRVIPCWTEGVAMMKVGGKSRLICPADIAYGDGGRPGIPGGATLAFDVELLEIVP